MDVVLARHAYGFPLERFFIFWAYICNFSKNSISLLNILFINLLYSKKDLEPRGEFGNW